MSSHRTQPQQLYTAALPTPFQQQSTSPYQSKVSSCHHSAQIPHKSLPWLSPPKGLLAFCHPASYLSDLLSYQPPSHSLFFPQNSFLAIRQISQTHFHLRVFTLTTLLLSLFPQAAKVCLQHPSVWLSSPSNVWLNVPFLATSTLTILFKCVTHTWTPPFLTPVSWLIFLFGTYHHLTFYV